MKSSFAAGLALAALVGLIIVAFGGCGTLGGFAKSCEPSPTQEAAILQAASTPGRAAALAAIDGLGFALCILQAGADHEIAQLMADASPDAGAPVAARAKPDPTLGNLMAWRAAHP